MGKTKTNKYLTRTLALFIVLMVCGFAHAQQRAVTGTVTDASDGTVIPGVNVIVKGTTNGTSTDFDGNYSITVDNGETLVFSYIGYKTQEVAVQNDVINIALQADVDALDEVVVIGYGTSKKSDITGSVSSVKSKELTDLPLVSAQQALQGRAAGVAVQSNNGGEPGAPVAISIRGNTSLSASSSALVVVDGFVGGAFPQPADIESVEILKDASATAIYGSRGANGVIMVTTKKGRSGKMVVEINSSYSSQEITETLDVLNANQFAAYRQAIEPAYVQGPANVNYQDLIYQTGYTSNHQLSFSGGNDQMNYYVSGNYYDQKGIVLNSDFERFSFLSNIDAQISDRIKLGFNAFARRSNRNGTITQPGSGGQGDAVVGSYSFAPDTPVKDENGVNTVSPVGDEFDNPVAVALESIDDTKTDDFRANFYADIVLFEGLSFKTTFGYSTENRFRGTFLPSTLTANTGGSGARGSASSLKSSTVLTENYLTYNKEFGKANFTALAGYSYQKDVTETVGAASTGILSNSLSYNNLAAATNFLTPTTGFAQTEIISMFGRLNLEYDDRYLLTFTARRDGASNFAKNEKYAFFPSGALGWRLSNEQFLKDSKVISNLKLRASYGVTGNPSIRPYQSLASLLAVYSSVGDTQVSAVVPEQLANPDLKWESSYQTNFGIDMGFLDNRISASVDFYNIDTKDLILGDSSAPEYFGFANPTQLRNLGEINNKGVEITLSTKNIVTDNFTWSTDLNWSTNKAEVVSLIDGDDIFLTSAPGSFLQNETHVLREGEPVGVFWGYEYRGVNQGTPLPETAGYEGTGAGDELFTDLNDDGVITTEDRKIIGDPNPDWIVGINNNFTYKNFDMNMFFQGSYGGDIFSYTLLELASGDTNATTDVLNAWTPSNTDTNIPSAAIRAKRLSDRFVYDGSYLRLKNLSVGYNFPTSLIEKIGLQALRLSISGQNLLTITSFPGVDPEVSYRAADTGTVIRESNTNLGFEYGTYPNIRSYTMAINLKF